MPARKREKTGLRRQRSKSYLDVRLNHHISGEVVGRGREARTELRRSEESWGFHADNTTLMAESEQELKSLLMKVKEESEKVG